MFEILNQNQGVISLIGILVTIIITIVGFLITNKKIFNINQGHDIKNNSKNTMVGRDYNINVS